MRHLLFAVLGRACLIAAVVLLVQAAVLMQQILVFLAILTVFVLYRRGMLPRRTSDAYGSARWCNCEEAYRGGLFSGRGLFLGRFAGPPGNRLAALVRLFTLPIGQSGIAVRQFLSAWTGR
jgi:type IV secretory pathway TraG/TraD family ATPase VirD4